MKWEVRKTDKNKDSWRLVALSRHYSNALMPYTLNKLTTEGYIDQFMVAEGWPDVYKGDRSQINSLLYFGGAVHFVPSEDLMSQNLAVRDKAMNFLYFLKQVPNDIIAELSYQRDSAMIGQVICPGKGSFYAILEEAKKQFEEIWCWMSISGPSYKSYQRYGFILNMEDVREFWNVYKCGYSKFVLGKWKR